MWKNNLSLRVAAPTVLVSGLLLAFCVAAVVFLYSQQATSAAILGENVSSAQVAHDLENTLYDLVSLLRDRNEQVGALHKRIRQQLAQAGQLADKAAERQLVGEIQDSFERYLRQWESRQAAPAGAAPDPLRAAVKLVET